MTTLNKETLIAAGGNFWEKGSLERVYLNDASIAKAFDLKLDDKAEYAGQFKNIGKAKVWFDCKKETLHSDKGLVRVMFNQNDIKCSK
jgi:hypothetical protein